MAKRVLEMINNIKMCANRGVSTLKIYLNRSFLLPLHKIGSGSAERSSKLDVLRSPCAIFASDFKLL